MSLCYRLLIRFRVGDFDELMKNFLRITKKVYDYPHRQQKSLIMARNDYMLEEENDRFFQVEFNLIAASLGPVCEGTRKVHRTINQLTNTPDSDLPQSLAPNTEEFIKAFKAAHKAYGKKEAVIVMVMGENENSKFD